MTQLFTIGDLCKIRNLTYDTTFNGHFCEIMKDLAITTVLETDGVRRTKMRYGIRMLGKKNITGYMVETNLELVASHDDPAQRRAVMIHATGREEA